MISSFLKSVHVFACLCMYMSMCVHLCLCMAGEGEGDRIREHKSKHTSTHHPKRELKCRVGPGTVLFHSFAVSGCFYA